MNIKHISIVIAAGLFGAIASLFAVRQLVVSQPEPLFHEHADFALFLNGQRFDFAQDVYMSVQPCVVRAEGGIPFAYAHEGESTDDFVHLHDMDGDVVHVHRAGITWHDFFDSLKMSFTDTSFVDDAGNTYEKNETHSFRFFVNGEEVQTLANREIRDLDRVTITYGRNDRDVNTIAAEIGAVTNKACQSSGACAHRGPQPLESCNASEAKPSPLLLWLGIKR